MSPIYSEEPPNKTQFTAEFDGAYTQYAGIYDLAVKALPFWKTWIKQALPHIRGSRVLEVSFGTSYLLTHYTGNFDTYGLDYNHRMACTANQNLKGKGLHAYLQVGDVEALPYPHEIFDSLVNTMAFTGYPDGNKAMSELWRVLKPSGRLILIDINYPSNHNRKGNAITRVFASLGDIIRDMDPIFRSCNIAYQEHEIGGFGSVHLYFAEKN
jgi:ubiquinone/menaquinone biosynthesis C-methylase UbiE